MSTAYFYIEVQVQNVETDEHIKVVEETIGTLTSMISANLIMLLGESCVPKISARGESFARGRWTIDIKSPDEIE